MFDDDRVKADEYEGGELQAGFLAKLPLRSSDWGLVVVTSATITYTLTGHDEPRLTITIKSSIRPRKPRELQRGGEIASEPQSNSRIVVVVSLDVLLILAKLGFEHRHGGSWESKQTVCI